MFAAVCVLLAATGHILMSGRPLPVGTLSAAFVGVAAVAWGLAGRERGLYAVTAAAVTVQSALHTAFAWSQPAEAPDAVTARAAMGHTHPAPGVSPSAATGHEPLAQAAAGHGLRSHAAMGQDAMAHAAMGQETVAHAGVRHDVLAHAGAAITGAPGGHDMADMSASLGMLSAHLIAALLSGLWMACGERAAFRMLRALPLGLFRPLRLLFAVAVPVPRERPCPRTVRAGDERPPRRLFLAHSVISRGPPPALAVL